MAFISEYRVYYRNDKHLSEDSSTDPLIDTQKRFEVESEANDWIELNGYPFLDYLVVKVLRSSEAISIGDSFVNLAISKNS